MDTDIIHVKEGEMKIVPILWFGGADRTLKTRVLLDDPGFEGTFRDFANQAEKLGLIDSADAWMRIRELRNISAHDYSESDLGAFFRRLRDETPRLLSIEAVVE